MKKLPKPKKPRGYNEKKAVKETKFKAKPPKKSGLMPGFMKDPSDLETVRASLGLKKKPESIKRLREVLEPPEESDPLETYADDILAMNDFEIPKLKSEKTLMDKTISQINIKKELLKLRREKRQLQEEQQQIKELLVKTSEKKVKLVIPDVYNEVKKTLKKLKSKSESLKEKERSLFHKFKKLMLAGKTIEQTNLSINERFAKIRELQEQVETHEVRIESVTSFNSLNAFIKDIDFYLTAVKKRKKELKIDSEFIEKERQFHRFLKNRIINKKSLNASLNREVQGLEKVEIYNLIDETFTLLRKEQIKDARNNYKLIRKKYSEYNIKNPEIYDSIYSLYKTITS
jgi:DNA repair exonuclease SbcCD ATPase subunit